MEKKITKMLKFANPIFSERPEFMRNNKDPQFDLQECEVH